jgi:hypothetical protein
VMVVDVKNHSHRSTICCLTSQPRGEAVRSIISQADANIGQQAAVAQ